jgi:UDP-N-acetylmuramoylalanine--D-glutamate ligase
MVQLPHYDGRIAVYGLGRSGRAVAQALMAAGNDVVAWDDLPEARAQAHAEGIALQNPIEDITAITRLILSPGIALTHPAPHPVVAAVQAANIPVEGDIDMLADAVRGRVKKIIAITGTNGKSTCTALITHILQHAGLSAVMGGNIGVPVVELDVTSETLLVLELSSYQIDLLHRLHPDIVVLTNLTPDHIDRHGSMDGYVAAKARLFELLATDGTIVSGIDGKYERAVVDAHKDRNIKRVSTQGLDADISADGTMIQTSNGARFHLSDNLPGRHNAQNAALAIGVCQTLGLAADHIQNGLNSFAGLEHRLQTIGAIDRVRFVNDSKATNAEACGHALRAFENIYWIAGGRPKSDGLSGLENDLQRVTHAYLIGEAAASFAEFLAPLKVPHEISKELSRAVERAAQDARRDGSDAVVLFSPACASFDQFANFEARGHAFRDYVMPMMRGEDVR